MNRDLLEEVKAFVAEICDAPKNALSGETSVNDDLGIDEYPIVIRKRMSDKLQFVRVIREGFLPWVSDKLKFVGHMAMTGLSSCKNSARLCH